MMEPFDAYIHRHFRYSTSPFLFDLSKNPNSAPSWLKDVPLSRDDCALLSYENSPGTSDDALVLSRQAIYLNANTGWRRFGYADIRAVGHPEIHESEDKLTMEQIDLRLESSEVIVVPVRGGISLRSRLSWTVLRTVRIKAQIERNRERRRA